MAADGTSRLGRLGDYLQLARLELMLQTISGAWVMVFLAYGLETHSLNEPGITGWPLGAVLGLTAVAAAGLHIYGMAINDALDLRHDKVFSPRRPLAAGRLTLRTALLTAVVSLVAALLAATALGPRTAVLGLLAALGLAFYSAVGKYVPGIGLLTLAGVRLAIMLMGNPYADYLWPVWLGMTHLLVTAAIAHRLEGKRPQFDGVHVWVASGGWLLVSLLMIMWMRGHDARALSEGRALWLGPAAAVAALVLTALWWRWSTPVTMRRRRAMGRRLGRWGLFWLMLYDAGWLMSADLYWQGAVALGMFLISVAVWEGMKTLDEWTQPLPAPTAQP